MLSPSLLEVDRLRLQPFLDCFIVRVERLESSPQLEPCCA